jgi:perosamine synthetase
MRNEDDNLIPFPGGRNDDASAADLADGALRSGWLTQGLAARRLQDDAADLVDARPIVPVAGGSAALHLALLSLELKPDDEVVLPVLSGAGSANLVLLAGGRPVFADAAAPDDPLVDAGAVARRCGPATRAIVAQHHAGFPGPLAALRALADDRGVTLIEDCRPALGTITDGRPAGVWGDLAVFAFAERPDGGGLVACGDDDRRRRIEELRSAVGGPDEECFLHSCEATLAAGYGIDEAAATNGLARLAALDGELTERRRLAQLAAERLTRAGYRPLFPAITAADRPSFRTLPVLASSPRAAAALAEATRAAGIETVLPLPAHHVPPHNARLPRVALPNAEAYCARAVELGVSEALEELRFV